MQEHSQLANHGSREEDLRFRVTATGDKFSVPWLTVLHQVLSEGLAFTIPRLSFTNKIL